MINLSQNYVFVARFSEDYCNIFIPGHALPSMSDSAPIVVVIFKTVED